MNLTLEITSSVDLRLFNQRLEGKVLKVFEQQAENMEDVIRDQWVGWKYEGRKKGTTGRSREGWGHSIQATEGIRTITFFNKATHYRTGKAYAAYVARRKGATPEWKIVRDMLNKSETPKLISAVLSAIKASITRGTPKRVRENRQTKYNKFTLKG